jgi:hypothetical protein
LDILAFSSLYWFLMFSTWPNMSCTREDRFIKRPLNGDALDCDAALLSSNLAPSHTRTRWGKLEPEKGAFLGWPYLKGLSHRIRSARKLNRLRLDYKTLKLKSLPVCILLICPEVLLRATVNAYQLTLS